jgi:RNA polymerase sigma factor
MNNSELQNEVMEVKEGRKDINILIDKYQPFIFSTINEFKGGYIDESSDLSTIGMLAFKEAVENFDPDKGNFYSFAKKIIKLRLIDNYRKNKKVKEKEKAIYEDSEYKNKLGRIQQEHSVEKYLIEEENRIRKEEIKDFIKELSSYDITLDELEKLSPRKKTLKKMYYRSAEYIVERQDLYEDFVRTQRLPAKELNENLRINIKQLDRGRKYIISLIILKKGNYDLISKYVGGRY